MSGVTRQAFYKRDDEVLFRRLAAEEFVVQFVLGIREKDPLIGSDKLWRMYNKRFSNEYCVGRDAFRNILHERGLNIRRRHRTTRTTDSRHNLPIYPNLVKNIIPTRPNHIWVSDITYIPIADSTARLGHRFCFLTIIMDAYSKRIVGWDVGSTLETKFCLKALKKALRTLPEEFDETLIHHSDRGCQYASAEYIKQLNKRNVIPSMTESGNPKDNSMAERINGIIKNELLHGQRFTCLQQVIVAVSRAIAFYNRERPHSSINWYTPEEAHKMHGELKRHWFSWRETAIKKQKSSIE